MKKLCATLQFSMLALSLATGQEKESDEFDNLHVTATFQTNHLWRGLIITDKPVIMGQMWFDLNQEKSLTLGFWGAASLSNEEGGNYFHAIDYHIQYAKNGFSIGLWDLFNSTGVDQEVASSDVWNYSSRRTTHILDLRVAYEFQNNFPLRLELDVMLYGGAKLSEVRLKDNGKYKDNRYSTYVEASYPFIDKDNIQLTGIVGAGFALNSFDKGATYLYGDGQNDFDLVNLGLQATRMVHVFDQDVPISFMPMWNPSQKFSRVQFATSFTIF